MRKSFTHLALAAFLLATVPAAATAAPQTPTSEAASDALATTNTLLDQLDAGQYAAAEATFNTEMAAAVPAAQLQAAWESLPAQFGAATGRGESQVVEQNGLQIVVMRLNHERGDVIAQTAIDAEGKIAGFLVQPAPPADAAPQPAAAD